MSVKRLPEDNHIARFCRATSIFEDGRISPTAFHLRAGDSYLSVNWIEFFGKANNSEAVGELQNVFANKFRTVSAFAKFAVFIVGDAREAVSDKTEQKEEIFATHEPLDDDLSHAGINGITQENYPIIAAILAECVDATYPARPPAD